MGQTKLKRKQFYDDGWTPVTDTWAYASATTITVPSGAALIYSIGGKFKLTANSVVLQGYIITVADTLLTVVGDALTSHTFTATYYSKAATPLGFKHWFTYTPTGIAATNVTLFGRFCIVNKVCYVDFRCLFAGGITFTTYPTLPVTASADMIFTETDVSISGVAAYADAGTAYIFNNLYVTVVASGTTFKLLNAIGASFGATIPITWAIDDWFQAHFYYNI